MAASAVLVACCDLRLALSAQIQRSEFAFASTLFLNWLALDLPRLA
jgi:hypothetical protein